MAHSERSIPIHPDAPPKVSPGTACNGCGVCCLFEPCPLGMLLSRRRSGACAALRWETDRYRCGALVAAEEVLARALPRGIHWLVPALAPALRRVAGRWIAAGAGCDSSLEEVVRSAERGPAQASLAPGLNDNAFTDMPPTP